ncbi:MAG: hypothetical protein IPM45_17905 [Acidimicrobiales bacterium]|nr:hypothetical protein [Acidimicrobiales bacterium]
MSVQNGVENPGVLRRRHPAVVAAVVYSGCERVDPVAVVHRSNGFLVLDDARGPACCGSTAFPATWCPTCGWPCGRSSWGTSP